MVLSPLGGFYFLLLISLISALSTSSGVMMWVSLELNMLSFLPIMSSGGSLAMENSMKYFLIQSWASIIFLMGFFFQAMLFGNMVYVSLLSMLLKLGAAPLHSWFISILKSCSLWILILLSTAQKVIPLLVLNNFFFSYSFMLFFLVATVLVVMMSLPGSVSLNKILALSSMGNLIWFLVSSQVSMKLVAVFMIIYSSLLLGVLIMYSKYSYGLFTQMNSMVMFDKIMMVFVFMSLGGLPPLLGFLGKLMVLKNILVSVNILFILMIIYTSLMILYHYLSRTFFMMTYLPSMKYSMASVNNSWKKTSYLVTLVGFNLLMIMPM